MLLVVAVLFALLWLSALVPYAAGGSAPDPEGVGGTTYPVFVLDLVVVLPYIAAALVSGTTLQLGTDVGASAVLLAVSVWLMVRWVRGLRPVQQQFLRPGLWEG